MGARPRPDRARVPADVGAGRRRPDPAHDRARTRRTRPGPGSGSRRSACSRRGRRRSWTPRNRASAATSTRTRSRSPASASTSSRWPPASPRRSTSRTTAGCTARRTAVSPGRTSAPTGCRATSVPAGRPSARPEDVLDHPAQRRGPRPVRARCLGRRVEDRGPRRHLAAQRRRAAAARRLPRCCAKRWRDTLDPVGIAFGTKSGQLWHSRDEGRSWERITADLPEIWAVESLVVD